MIVTLIDTVQAMSLMPYVFMLPFYENYIPLHMYACTFIFYQLLHGIFL